MPPVSALLLHAFFSAVPVAEAAQVSLAVDSPTVSEGQQVGLVLTVTETSVRGGPPRFGVPDGLASEFESQEQEQLFLNMNLTTSTKYRYTLTALKAGDYTIPPLPVPTAAGTLLTGPVSLHVEARGVTTGGANELIGELSSVPQWVGQVVVYHLRFATDRQMGNRGWVAPEGKGFTRLASIDPVTSDYTVGEGGSRMAVEEVWMPLQFTQPGAVTMPGGALQAQFAVDRQRRGRPGQIEQLFPDLGMFQDIKQEVFSAPTVSLNLKSPPKDRRPAGYSGLVGQYTIQSRINGPVAGAAGSSSVKVGDTVTLAIDIAGDAPISGVTLPPLTQDGFRVYDDQPVTNAEIKDGKLVATASYKRAIVPERPGPLTIPAVTLSAFDPVTGHYVTLQSDAMTLDVVGSAASAQVASFASGAAAPAPVPPTDELLPVRPNPATSPPWRGRWSVALLVPGAFALLGRGGRELLARRRKAAGSRTRALGFDDLPADPHGRLSGLEQIFREAVAPRLGIGAAAVHGEDLVRLGDFAVEAQGVYRLLERARYAESGGSEQAGAAIAALEAAMREFLGRLA